MTQINVKGPIVSDGDKWFYDFLDMPATAPKDISDNLPEDSSDVTVVINSGGGRIDAGSEIYTALKAYPGNVNVNIVGMAASAASIVAMAGNHVAMSPTAQMMIHNVQSGITGDSQAHLKEAGVLETFNKSFATPYMAKSGMSEEEVLDIMNETTYFNAEDAKAKGLIDEVMFSDDEELELTASMESGIVSSAKIKEFKARMVDDFTAAEPVETVKVDATEFESLIDDFKKELDEKEAHFENMIDKLDKFENKPTNSEPAETKFSPFVF